MKQPKANVTIRDFPSVAGISLSTFSRVPNDREDVAPETVVVVRRAIEEMGYALDMAARRPLSRTSGIRLPNS